jgi:hypothetical protein
MSSKENFTRVNNDVNGNPRWVCHFTNLEADTSTASPWDISSRYNEAVSFARQFGGKRFHNKQYGGGVVFCTYDLGGLCAMINEALVK